MWARVCSSAPHSQEAVCESPSLFRCFLGPQCSVLRQNIVGCSRLLRWWMWSCSDLYSSCFPCQSALKFSLSSILALLYEVLEWGCWSLLPAFACLLPHFPECLHVPESIAALLCRAVTGCWYSPVAAWWVYQWVPTGGPGALTESLWVWNVLMVPSFLRLALSSSNTTKQNQNQMKTKQNKTNTTKKETPNLFPTHTNHKWVKSRCRMFYLLWVFDNESILHPMFCSWQTYQFIQWNRWQKCRPVLKHSLTTSPHKLWKRARDEGSIILQETLFVDVKIKEKNIWLSTFLRGTEDHSSLMFPEHIIWVNA